MYDEWKPEDSPVTDESQPYWTLWRVIVLLIVLITLIAFLIYTFSPLIESVLHQNDPAPLSIPVERA